MAKSALATGLKGYALVAVEAWLILLMTLAPLTVFRLLTTLLLLLKIEPPPTGEAKALIFALPFWWMKGSEVVEPMLPVSEALLLKCAEVPSAPPAALRAATEAAWVIKWYLNSPMDSTGGHC